MLFPTFKKKFGVKLKKKYIEKCPFTYWLNGRWFLQIVGIHVGNFNMKLTGRWFPQIVDIGNFNMRLEILKCAPSLTG